jgi:hypothetical protein
MKKSLHHVLEMRKTLNQIGDVNFNKFEMKWGQDMDML